MSISLDLLPQTAFVFMLIFSRLGAMIMMLPALGEMAIPAQVKIILALAITLVMMPLVMDSYGAIPSSIGGLATTLFFEIAVGLFIGMTARIIMSSLHVAGNLIALQTGLSFAQNVDPSAGGQGVLLANFLTMLDVALIFASNLDHLAIVAMRDSYILFKPGASLPVGDFTQVAVHTLSMSFKLGVQLAAPFLVMGLVFYVGIGILSRLMPQIQIYFISMPANIGLGLALFMLLLGAMMTWFMEGYEQVLMQFIN